MLFWDDLVDDIQNFNTEAIQKVVQYITSLIEALSSTSLSSYSYLYQNASYIHKVVQRLQQSVFLDSSSLLASRSRKNTKLNSLSLAFRTAIRLYNRNISCCWPTSQTRNLNSILFFFKYDFTILFIECIGTRGYYQDVWSLFHHDRRFALLTWWVTRLFCCVLQLLI